MRRAACSLVVALMIAACSSFTEADPGPAPVDSGSDSVAADTSMPLVDGMAPPDAADAGPDPTACTTFDVDPSMLPDWTVTPTAGGKVLLTALAGVNVLEAQIVGQESASISHSVPVHSGDAGLAVDVSLDFAVAAVSPAGVFINLVTLSCSGVSVSVDIDNGQQLELTTTPPSAGVGFGSPPTEKTALRLHLEGQYLGVTLGSTNNNLMLASGVNATNPCVLTLGVSAPLDTAAATVTAYYFDACVE